MSLVPWLLLLVTHESYVHQPWQLYTCHAYRQSCINMSIIQNYASVHWQELHSHVLCTYSPADANSCLTPSNAGVHRNGIMRPPFLQQQCNMRGN